MYVWGRMFKVVATTRRRGPFRAGDESRLSFRCLPTDIDPNLHLNNARYRMLEDVGRLDIFFRGGLMRIGRKNGWGPMMGGVQSVFVREIRLWRRFDVVSTIETWDGTQIIGRHHFELDDGNVAAAVLTTAGVYDFRGRRFVPIDEVLEALGYSGAPRQPTVAEQAFMESHNRLRNLAKSGKLAKR